jgi:hypothetical protein
MNSQGAEATYMQAGCIPRKEGVKSVVNLATKKGLDGQYAEAAYATGCILLASQQTRCRSRSLYMHY